MQQKTGLFNRVRHIVGSVLTVAVITVALACTKAEGQVFRKLHSFTAVPLTGSAPMSGLLQAKDGSFYGMTSRGGLSNLGAVFKMDPTGNLTTLYNCNRSDGYFPQGDLIQAKDGFLYGTMYAGGTGTDGVIFRVDVTTGKPTFVYNFTGNDGATPVSSPMQARDGFLYGTTSDGGTNRLGTVYRFDPVSKKLKSLWSFSGTDGSNPHAPLIQGKDGLLYGTTNQGGASKMGTVFRIDPVAGTLTVLHSFSGTGTDGANPLSGLIQATDGFLYGTTYQGGANSAGTLFKVDSAGNVSTVHSLATPGTSEGGNPTGALIQGTDGMLVGTTYTGGTNYSGTVFRFDVTSSKLTTVLSFDGLQIQGQLLLAKDGLFYGTAFAGGPNNQGAIFRVETNESVTVLNAFDNSTTDGARPWASLVQGTDGRYYGTSTGGGTDNHGVVFSVDADGNETVLYRFTGMDGSAPQGTLIQGKDGLLYGTTIGGGAEGQGTLFSLNPATQKLTTLYSFHSISSTGAHPWGGLLQGADGSLYGTTLGGGTTNAGTVFKVDVTGKNLSVLHNFTTTDGVNPQASLIQGKEGLLYGTTYAGGAQGNGTVFSIDPTSGNLVTLHSFTGTDGANPTGTLVQGKDGFLYGATAYGGANGEGVLYRMDVAGKNPVTLVTFNFTNGVNPTPGVIQGKDGFLYGMTYEGGASNVGTLFRVDIASQKLTTLYSFSGPDGGYPIGGLIQGSDGRLYGTAQNLGGIAEGTADGTVFAFDLQKLNATDVTSSMKVSSSGLTLDRSILRYTGTMTLTNVGKTNLVGPLTFVLNNLPSSVFLVNADGAIGSTLLTPYLVYTGTLKAGDAVTLPVDYYNPGGVKISYGIKAYAGSLSTPTPRLIGFTLKPVSVVGGTPETATLTLSSPAGTAGAVVTLTNDNAAAVTVPVHVTIPAGAASLTVALSTGPLLATASANLTATYASVTIPATLTIVPAAIAGITLSPSSVIGGNGTAVTVSLNGPAPKGGALVTLNSNPAVTAATSVTVPAGKTTAFVYLLTSPVPEVTPAQLAASYGGLTVASALTVNPPALTSLTLSPTSVTGGGVSTGNLTLNGPAPAGGVVVSLVSDNASVTAPSSVTVPAGATGVLFPISTLVVSSSTIATLTATSGASTRTAKLTVLPILASSITLNPSSVPGGGVSTATITLSGVAPTGGAVVQLSSNNAVAILPASVTIPAGTTSVAVAVFTVPVKTQTAATITATYGGVPTKATLIVQSPAVTGLTLSQSSVTGGALVTGTVRLSGVAAVDTVVTLTSGNAAATVPATVTIPAGMQRATFPITTSTPTANSVVCVIQATLGTSSASANLTVTR